nr:hypothetical protein Iba_chr01fCG8090 [Ipomoea batatas]
MRKPAETSFRTGADRCGNYFRTDAETSFRTGAELVRKPENSAPVRNWCSSVSSTGFEHKGRHIGLKWSNRDEVQGNMAEKTSPRSWQGRGGEPKGGKSPASLVVQQFGQLGYVRSGVRAYACSYAAQDFCG